jgi:2-dehydro-3-deoxy-D-arabinonate dehydratase
MKLCKVRGPDGTTAVGLYEADGVSLLDHAGGLSSILHAPDPAGLVRSLSVRAVLPLAQVKLLAPIDEQEVWAAGVTYRRSKVAREEESATTGGSRFYDMVYTAPRPELFFKSPARRVVCPGDPVRIRRDARWSVPEPEVAVVVSPALKIVGYTIGNDMSSRDIEGENPLYLPQAKFYDGACTLGPAITLAGFLPPLPEVAIRLTINRGSTVFEGSTTLAQMARSFEELVSWLGRETSFPDGVVLLTGTGIVPPDSFTLNVGDEVVIEVAGIGRLVNRVG